MEKIKFEDLSVGLRIAVALSYGIGALYILFFLKGVVAGLQGSYYG
jgi:hypothetical protein